MLHIENIDAYSIRIGDGYGGGTYFKVLPKSLEARKAADGRVWISHTEKKETIVNNEPVSEITLDGVVYGTGEEFVVAFNEVIASSTEYAITTTTTTAPVTTTTTTT